MINQLKTTILLAAMSGLLLFVGNLLGGTTGIAIAFVMAIVMNFATYFFSDTIVIKLYKAQPLDESQNPELFAMVRELTARMGLPMPKMYIVPTPMANAFATGRNPQHASVVVTQGIVSLLEPDELRGVLAHELGHVKNRDILITTVAATLATAIAYIASMMKFAAFFSSNKNNQERSRNPIMMLVVALLMPIAATIIRLTISRTREYLADETGGETCEDPMALASALSKLEKHIPDAHLDSRDTLHTSTAPLFIVNPFLNEGFASLFRTHPPTAKRIERLRALAQKLNNR